MTGARGSVTAVASVGAVTGAVSFESIVQPLAWIRLPETAEDDTRTVIRAKPVPPETKVPGIQVTWFPVRTPPSSADTKVVPAGTVAWIWTPVAGAFPELPKLSV